MSAGPEDILQMQAVRFLRLAAPDCLFWHCPNGGSRHPGEARKFRDMGVLPGVADLCFLLPDGRAAFIELKSDKGRQQPAQVAFADACERRGAPYAVCRSLEAVVATLEGWGVRLAGRVS